MARRSKGGSEQISEIAIQIEQLQRKEAILDYMHTLSLEELILLEEFYHKSVENMECRKVYPDGRHRVRIFNPRTFDPDLTTTSPQKRAILNKIPEFAVLPQDDVAKTLKQGREIWEKSVEGLDSIYRKMILHIVSYIKSGTTRPLLFVGVPGSGKSMAARVYGEILGLYTAFIACPRMATSRGLYGDAPTYQESSCGAIVEAIIRSKTGLPVFVLDEIDKAGAAKSRGSCDIQNEALNLIHEASGEFVDNYLQCPVDVSHSPVIFTANEVDDISAPLIDRCELIDFPVPTAEHINLVSQRFIVPALMKKLGCADMVKLSKRSVEEAVDKVYRSGAVSIRIYQSMFENVISSAYVRAVCEERTQQVSDKDISSALEHTITSSRKSIGF